VVDGSNIHKIQLLPMLPEMPLSITIARPVLAQECSALQTAGSIGLVLDLAHEVTKIFRRNAMSFEFIHGNVLEVAQTMKSQSVHCMEKAGILL